MRAAFAGFPPQALAFFRGLARHNDRDWFLPRKAIYEENIRQPMIALVEALNAAFREAAPAYATEPACAIYRIYRDVRFSSDKRPYKTNIAASFYRRGMAKHGAAGYYFGISASEVEVGGGIYLPPPETLRIMRAHLAMHQDEFEALAGARGVRRLIGEVQGERLARPPKGFTPDHPAADLVRLKQCYWYVTLDPGLATTPRLFPEICKRFRALTPLVDFLNAPLVAANRRLLRERSLPLMRL